ncbi:MAG: S8 family serine peptidase [Candidatus Cyclobacteriaceae bacterium M3_2C_046]
MLKYIFWLILWLLTSQLQAQSKYWIYFADKGNDIRQNIVRTGPTIPLLNIGAAYLDKPIYQPYLDSLNKLNINPIVRSKWLNAVSAQLNDETLMLVKTRKFIHHVQPVRTMKTANQNLYKEKHNLSLALEQIKAHHFIQAGLTGKDVDIGIIDGGFYQADQDSNLVHLFENDQIKAYKDFVNPEKNKFYSQSESLLDWHGTSVWNLIGGYHPSQSKTYGLAVQANYYLARTDHGQKEFRGEEDYWIAAIEWLDSLNVKLINTSLGYALDFDNPEENYAPEQMDGQTSAIARAAQIAVDQKDMLIIVSAGNDGNNPAWQVLSTPADAEGVFSVGSSLYAAWGRINYSALGPEFLPYLKPNVVCYSSHGTSFSAPVITGLAAGIKQAQPGLSNRQIMNIIERSAHLYPFGNNYIGYGVPDCGKILKILHKEHLKDRSKKIRKRKRFTLKNKHQDAYAVIFHKKDSRHVLYQEIIEPIENKFEVTKPENAKISTFASQSQVLEIIWK